MKVVKRLRPGAWKKLGLAVTRDSVSRMEGVKPNISKVVVIITNEY